MSERFFENPEDLIRRIYAYVSYRIGDGPEAEDVTSATVERALRYRASFDPSKGEPIAWLLGIASRCLREAYGQREDVTAIEDDDLATPDHAELSLDRVAIHEAVAKLSGRDRELIALRYGADLSAREIARLTGTKTNAVEVALHRAVKRLRHTLEA